MENERGRTELDFRGLTWEHQECCNRVPSWAKTTEKELPCLLCVHSVGGLESQSTGHLMGQPLLIQLINNQLALVQSDCLTCLLADPNKIVAAMIYYLVW
ncbi:MAG: hypothetical protein ACJ8FY_00675 [Gemmataceae bacterium]